MRICRIEIIHSAFTDKGLVEIAELDWDNRGRNIYRNERSFQKNIKVVLPCFVNCAQFSISIYIRQLHCCEGYLRRINSKCQKENKV